MQVCEFHSGYEHICDAAWCPVRPSVFASINSSSELSIWDLTHSMEHPRVAPVRLQRLKRKKYLGFEPETVDEPASFTKLAFAADGQRLAVGDLSGKVRELGARWGVALCACSPPFRARMLLADDVSVVALRTSSALPGLCDFSVG